MAKKIKIILSRLMSCKTASKSFSKSPSCIGSSETIQFPQPKLSYQGYGDSTHAMTWKYHDGSEYKITENTKKGHFISDCFGNEMHKHSENYFAVYGVIDTERKIAAIRSGHILVATIPQPMQLEYPVYVSKMHNAVHQRFRQKGNYAPFKPTELTLAYLSAEKLPPSIIKHTSRILNFELYPWVSEGGDFPNQFHFKIDNSDQIYPIESKNPHSTTFALSIIVAFAEQEPIDIYINTNTGKPVYVSPPYKLLHYIYKIKRSFLQAPIQLDADIISALKPSEVVWVIRSMVRNSERKHAESMQV